MLIWSPLKLATPLEAATDVVPAAKLPEDSATWMVSFDPVLPVVIGVAVLVLDGHADRDRAAGGDGGGGLGGDHQLVLGGRGHGERVGGRRGDGPVGGVAGGDGVAAGRRDLRLLKVATPLEAATDVVPAAKLPEDSATWIVSLEPVLPVVIGLPYWSSTVTPTVIVAPAADR